MGFSGAGPGLAPPPSRPEGSHEFFQLTDSLYSKTDILGRDNIGNIQLGFQFSISWSSSFGQQSADMQPVRQRAGMRSHFTCALQELSSPNHLCKPGVFGCLSNIKMCI